MKMIVKRVTRIPLNREDVLTLVEGEAITLLREKAGGFLLGNRQGEFLAHITKDQVYQLSGETRYRERV